MVPVFFDHCACGAPSNGVPHNHMGRLMRFADARRAKTHLPIKPAARLRKRFVDA